MTTRAIGMDTYSLQYRRDNNNKLIVPSFASLTAHLDFVFVKSSEGNWMDPDFPTMWQALAAPAPMRMMYHYQRSGVSWQQQADNFLSMMPSDCMGLALDIEKINNVVDKTMMADSSRILNYLKAHTTKKVMFYSNQDMYMNYILPIMQANWPGDTWYLDFPFWIASEPFWKPSRSPDNNPTLPKGMRADWKIIQWNDSGDTYPYSAYGSPDLDAFNGSAADMMTWLGATAPAPQPAPAPTPAPTTGQTIISLNKDLAVTVLTSDPNTTVKVELQ